MNRYEQLLELVQARRSVRKFSDRGVSREDLLRLLEAARWAPSGHNRQPWKFLILDDKDELRRLAEAIERGLVEKAKSLPEIARAYVADFLRYATFFAEAPALIVALHRRPVSVSGALVNGLGDPALVSGEPLSMGMAVQNLMLAAQTLGLGTCVLTAPLMAQEAVVSRLPFPAGHDLTCFIAVGYPAEAPLPPQRKNLDQILEFRNNGCPNNGAV